MPYYFYILRCSDNSLYCGVTCDLQKRLLTHNTGKGAKYTRSRRPVVLIHSEGFNDKSSALVREAQVKTWKKAKKEAFVAKTW
ncbi:methyltransferase [Candidatus Woesebacteria bacterium RIFCSPHIGHO2_01_FULL_41_10]|uniref:Methyltransferase n=1 Tax=Candidatus Woesebacteria bacterium RIFCSPHIGHO2_01_FULL_41_10 TaxID=1802500 RepID=A0A1F7YN70_9BACT|nr:MAG: methyltransferase [Candidatus Woesebacteria bacterium RIFCSPHIGHO2_01_FULL_41_10]